MNCPHCANVGLVMTERSGIEIDYCPACRGVWLDRGELDKIIERATEREAGGRDATSTAQPAQPMHPAPQPYRKSDSVDDDDYPHHDNRRYPRRKSFWSELFD